MSSSLIHLLIIILGWFMAFTGLLLLLGMGWLLVIMNFLDGLGGIPHSPIDFKSVQKIFSGVKSVKSKIVAVILVLVGGYLLFYGSSFLL